MDEYLSEREQVEKIRNWWSDNGSWVIAGIVLGVALLVGWNAWQNYVIRRAEDASALYTQLAGLVEKGELVADGANIMLGYWKDEEATARALKNGGYHTGDIAYQEGAEVAAGCTGCHGEHGVSTTPGIPSLAGQQPAYLMVSTQEYASGSRGHAEKEEMLRGLGEVDIEKMALYFASQAPELRDPPPFGDPQAGEPLTANCGSCHGARGISQDPMVPNLAGQEPTYLVNAIKAYRSKERSHEDMVTDKSDGEIESIAAFYSVQAAGSVTEAGEQTDEVIAKCERCHGRAEGESTMVVPVLRGQKQEYLLHVMKQYRDGERGNSMMHKMSSGYSDDLLEEIAAYYATHPRD